MEFRAEDIKRLYGKRFFQLPDLEKGETSETKEIPSVTQAPAPEDKEEPEPIDPTTFLLGGDAIDWKMKPAARLSLVLDAETFADRQLTSHLKQAVLEAGIDVKGIGFGVFPTNSQKWDFTDMPVGYGIIMGACNDQLTEIASVEGKTIIPAPLLAKAVKDADAHALLIKQLQKSWQLASKA